MREWNNCFIKNARKISRILPDFIRKTTDFQLVFNFEHTRTERFYLNREIHVGSRIVRATMH